METGRLVQRSVAGASATQSILGAPVPNGLDYDPHAHHFLSIRLQMGHSLPVRGRREEPFVCANAHPNASPVIAAARGAFQRTLGGAGCQKMPRYFFHVKRGQMTVLDQEGIELADIAEAEIEAARRAQEIVSGEASKGVPPSSGQIIVADESWQRLFELPF